MFNKYPPPPHTHTHTRARARVFRMQPIILNSIALCDEIYNPKFLRIIFFNKLNSKLSSINKYLVIMNKLK